jgi:hypothetical protein
MIWKHIHKTDLMTHEAALPKQVSFLPNLGKVSI